MLYAYISIEISVRFVLGFSFQSGFASGEEAKSIRAFHAVDF